MWFAVLWLILGFVLIISKHIRRSWITGQTAFTGIWFVSLTALWANPPSWDYVSREAVLIIGSAHFIFFLGSVVTSIFFRKRGRLLQKEVAPTRKTGRVLLPFFWMFVLVGVIGSWLTVSNTGAFIAYQENTLNLTRSLLITGGIQIPIYQRLMSNFLYPASLLGAIYFLFSKRSWYSWSYLFIPLVGTVMYSFSFGGRGAIMIGGSLIFWILVFSRAKVLRRRVNTLERWMIIFLGFVVFGYFAMIVATRTDVNPSDIAQSIYEYLIGPIPAFSEWLTFQSLSLGNIDLSNISLIRELLRLWGIDKARDIGLNIVYIPFVFNVFTHLAEHVRDFGIVGALIVSGILGILTAILESKTLSVSVIGIRATIYAYLSISLFADLSYLAVGWWLTLLTIAFIVPLWAEVSLPTLNKSIRDDWGKMTLVDTKVKVKY